MIAPWKHCGSRTGTFGPHLIRPLINPCGFSCIIIVINVYCTWARVAKTCHVELFRSSNELLLEKKLEF